MNVRTVVHLLRHGEVNNPSGVLYGRLPGFHLSETGRAMAARLADYVSDFDLAHLRCSPLERAQETMAPIAESHGLAVTTDERVIEAGNRLEGQRVAADGKALRNPRNWAYLRNPLRPSWGEPYVDIAARMRLALRDAVAEAEGHEALIVSHQLPIWTARRDVEGRWLAHDPRKRDCTLASLTSITFLDGRATSVSYSEPAADLLPRAKAQKTPAGA
ncbi:MAG TPA: histidine phosphatase family protein [Propionibacteriaceae bacterium]|nr:histidine phosphatase family protein [Propionibacteriaceae bacterium]